MSSLAHALAPWRWPGVPGPYAVALLVLALLAAFVVAANAALGPRLFPAVQVGGIEVGGLTPAEARARLDGAAAGFAERSVSVRVGDRVWSSTYGELGISVDLEGAVATAASYGHEGDLRVRLASLADLVTKGGASFGVTRVAEGDRLAAFLAEIATAYDKAPVDGAIALAADGVKPTMPENGLRFPRESVTAQILAAGGLEARDLSIDLVRVVPAIDFDRMAEALTAVRTAYAPLEVTVSEQQFALTPAQVLALVRIERQPAAYGGEALAARVDDGALDALAAELAAKFDRAPRDASYKPGAKNLEVIPSLDGVAIDRAGLKTQLASAVFTESRTVQAQAQITPATFTTAQAQEFASRMVLVAGYTTYFPVNPARAKNIGLAAGRFNGQTVAPGQTFSFWGRVGEVSYRAGFVDAGVIIDGKSDTGLAGGICQVSTTFFNAVARAGYKINERHQHSYYIQRYPIGLDAAVLWPGADFRWTNDTGAPILIRTAATSTSVTFWLYSVPTGRTVSFGTPSQTNFRDPAPNQAADPAYPKGYVVRGRDVVATRTVRQGDTVLYRDAWFSRYHPVWGGPADTLSYH